ncbi:MAG: hormogonium polysaccharide biosynthesis protein HpsL [Scytolyngbya sp. HA4215-MV1]|jgi:hypothetical protein|nr:hormogonium polysaccharide biosynthesis protein HpsL [Scytolyngbya sp. HA4215-MV1]
MAKPSKPKTGKTRKVAASPAVTETASTPKSPKSKKNSKVAVSETATEAASTSALSRQEQKELKRKARRERQEFIGFLTTMSFISLVLGAPLFVVGGVRAALGGAIGILCLAFSFKYPRKALWAFLIYMPFSGTVVYGLAGGNALMQLAKDIFYIPAAIGIFMECRRTGKPFILPKEIVPWFTILMVICMLVLLSVNGAQAFAPASTALKPPAPENPIAMGILGLKALLGYLPLIGCAYYLVRDKKDLLFTMRLHVVLALTCCALGFIQFLLLKTGRCQATTGTGVDLFKASVQSRCFVGGALLYSPEFGAIRLPGTFVAPWQWGWFLIANAFIIFASAFSEPSILWRPVSLVSLASVFVMSVISGQRIALALVPLATVALLVITGQVTNLKRFIPVGIGLGLILGGAAAANPAIVQDRVQSFIDRWNASPPTAFISEQLSWALDQGGALGHGLGRATNAARAFGDVKLIETYYPKVIYEIGVTGTIVFLIMVSVLTYVTFKAYRSVKDRVLRSYGASLWTFVLFISYNTYYYPLDVDPVAVYYWFFAGIILTLPKIARQEQEKLDAIAMPESKVKKGKRKRLPEPTPAPT